MKNIRHLLLLALIICIASAAWADNTSPTLSALNKVRILPLAGHEKDVLGAKILASNVSPDDGFVELGQIKDMPAAGQWGEVAIANTTPYRWIKYLAAPGTFGRVAKLEFYSAETKLKMVDLYSGRDRDNWRRALDDSPAGNHQSDMADNQYVVIDIGIVATGPCVTFAPGMGVESKVPIKVAIQSSLPGAVIRYTLDGTDPTPENSQVYSAPITIDKTTTLDASAFVSGHAPTPSVWATYIIGELRHINTFHAGHSLTGITGHFDFQAYTAGSRHHSAYYILGGSILKALWNAAMLPIGDPADKDHWIDLYSTRIGYTVVYSKEQIQQANDTWNKVWPATTQIDDFTLQTWDWDIAEEVDYENRFLSLVEQKAPNAQPWMYVSWTYRDRPLPTDLGKLQSPQMQKVYPALTWEESMAAMAVYGEDVKSKIEETYKGAKPVHIIPASLAMGRVHRMIEEGQMPGFGKDDFYVKLFSDKVHPNPEGAYLVDCMFYSAFYGESPEGKFLPVRTHLTGPQALAMQRLAWDTMTNYP